MTRLALRLLAVLMFAIGAASPAFAQDDDDTALRLAEPDFVIVSLPTSLRLAPFKSAFRVTHRFGLALEGDFGDLASDLFGLDNGAVIGLEYRIGIVRNGQIGIHRSSSGKDIELFGQYGLMRQSRGPIDISALVAIEGTDNFQENFAPSLGIILSRTVGDWAAFYVNPTWVNNTNPLPKELVDDNNTSYIGVGARIRFRPTVYVVGEVAPRVAGFEPGSNHAGFGIEKRAGGHMFQLNFTTSRATTPRQIALGGAEPREWAMGFNITRKFF